MVSIVESFSDVFGKGDGSTMDTARRPGRQSWEH